MAKLKKKTKTTTPWKKIELAYLKHTFVEICITKRLAGMKNWPKKKKENQECDDNVVASKPHNDMVDLYTMPLPSSVHLSFIFLLLHDMAINLCVSFENTSKRR